MKTAVITGVTGQAGSYFSEYLLNKGLKVIGTFRRLSVPNHINILPSANHPNFVSEQMDLGDPNSINAIIQKYKPEYFINAAANSYVGSSWTFPEQHINYNTLGVLRQLESIKNYSPNTRYLNFGSSEQFGDVLFSPQNEKHPARARSPYGVSKIAAHEFVKVYRESFNLYAIQPWCFNYESPRRGLEFVTRKITVNLARIVKSLKENKSFLPLELGNIYAQRDWSHALDIVEGMWIMLNQEEFRAKQLEIDNGSILVHKLKPKEYVLSSGKTYTIKEFINKALSILGIDYEWQGKELDEKCFIKNTEIVLVKINKDFYRPAEVDLLIGDSSLIQKDLGWKPKHTLDNIIKEMLENDLRLVFNS